MKTPIPVYGGTIHFFTDFAKFNAHHKKVNKDEVEHALGWTSEYKGADGSSNIMIGVFDGDPQTLVHECIHVGLNVFERCNIDPSAESGEPFAYLVDCLFGMFVNKLERSSLERSSKD